MSNPKDLVGAKKAPLGVVPVALVIGVAPAMAVGASKYGPFNWREQPVQVMTYVEAIQRHLYAFVDGQDVAEDTGVSHLAHAGAGLAILMDAYALDRVIDNRPSKGPAADMLRSQDHSEAPVPVEGAALPLPEEELCVCHTPGVPLGPEHIAFTRNFPHTENVGQWISGLAQRNVIEELKRPILCICPPVRASYGDHLLTCPRYEVDLPEPYRDVGGEG